MCVLCGCFVCARGGGRIIVKQFWLLLWVVVWFVVMTPKKQKKAKLVGAGHHARSLLHPPPLCETQTKKKCFLCLVC